MDLAETGLELQQERVVSHVGGFVLFNYCGRWQSSPGNLLCKSSHGFVIAAESVRRTHKRYVFHFTGDSFPRL